MSHTLWPVASLFRKSVWQSTDSKNAAVSQSRIQQFVQALPDGAFFTQSTTDYTTLSRCGIRNILKPWCLQIEGLAVANAWSCGCGLWDLSSLVHEQGDQVRLDLPRLSSRFMPMFKKTQQLPPVTVQASPLTPFRSIFWHRRGIGASSRRPAVLPAQPSPTTKTILQEALKEKKCHPRAQASGELRTHLQIAAYRSSSLLLGSLRGAPTVGPQGEEFPPPHTLHLQGIHIAVFSIYLQSGGCINTAPNIGIVAALMAALSTCTTPWIVTGDWNQDVEEVQDSGLEKKTKGVIVAPEGATIGSGNTLDFALMSRDIAACTKVTLLEEVPCKPHAALVLPLRSLMGAFPSLSFNHSQRWSRTT